MEFYKKFIKMISNIFLFFAFISSIDIYHDCNLTYANLDVYQNDSINYIISCPNTKTQKIKMQNPNHIKSILIFNKSIVHIECQEIIPKCFDTNILLFNDPNLTVHKKCCFGEIQKYDSNSFDISDKTGLFAYKANMFDHLNDQISFLSKRKIDDDKRCSHDLNIYLSQSLRISCESEFNIQLSFDELKNYTFNQYGNSIVFHNVSMKNINMKNIISSFKIYQKPNLVFNDFIDGNSVVAYSELFQVTIFTISSYIGIKLNIVSETNG